MAKTYSERLRDPRWQRKRLTIMERDGFACVQCGDKTNTLNVHHIYYVKGDPWDAPDEALETLCDPCHEVAEDTKRLVLLLASRCRYAELRESVLLQLGQVAKARSIPAQTTVEGLQDLIARKRQEMGVAP